MWRIVYINDGYAIMNLVSEETYGTNLNPMLKRRLNI